MSVEKHIRLFDKIAGIYNLFFGAHTRYYIDIIKANELHLNIEAAGSVLDVGCGTGAFASAFKKLGFQAAGVDGSKRMAEMATRNGIKCIVADCTNQMDFEDAGFDLVCAGYVAHGLSRPDRMDLYHEMKRISRKTVLLHDYSPADRGFGPFTVMGILEALERSHYIDFRNNALAELREVFSSVRAIVLDNRVCWYVCDATLLTPLAGPASL